MIGDCRNPAPAWPSGPANEQRADEIEQERDKHFVDAPPEMDGGCDR
jgi:hypothetical protein